MRSIISSILAFSLFILCISCQSQEAETDDNHQTQSEEQAYTFKKGDPNGIGKWYMGREIAHVMGYQGINWLERDEREEEENTKKLIDNMEIDSRDVIADIGAGSGYHVFKMAPLAKQGTVYAVDIQAEMLETIAKKNEREGFDSIELVKGSEQSTNLPQNKIDKVLMVDVYHEFSFPKEMLQSIYGALKADGKVYLVEYRKEDQSIPIKEIHKMSQEQAVKEFEASGFKLIENIKNLPWQHCMAFGKKVN